MLSDTLKMLKMVSVIQSCRTEEQLETAAEWLMNLKGFTPRQKEMLAAHIDGHAGILAAEMETV